MRNLEQTIQMVKGKNDQAISTLNEHKVLSMNLTKGLMKKEMAAETALQERKRMVLGGVYVMGITRC